MLIAIFSLDYQVFFHAELCILQAVTDPVPLAQCTRI